MSREATIEMPVKLIKKMDNAVKTIEDFVAAFEGFILAKDKKLIGKIYKARKEHLSGHTKLFSELKKKYV